MKMIMVVYNEAIDMEVMAILSRCANKNYTKLINAYGKGNSSGVHMGDDIWPGLNNVLFIACADKDANIITTGVKELRKELGKEGVKAFTIPMEETD